MIETERLILRHWKKRDRAAFSAMNADPAVMRYFPGTLTSDESNDNLARMEGWDRESGLTLWPAIRKADGAFLGICGLKPFTIPWPYADDIEIGWRFAAEHWGQGYAREAAEACITLGLTHARRVVAMTVPANRPSWGLMRRLGMAHRPELDFAHPNVPEGSPLKWHVVHTREA